jgi:uncharacterized YccA/Bax inhibitor family protein
MANPVLGRGFGSSGTINAGLDAGLQAPTTVGPVADDVMTFGGAIRASAILLGLVFAGAAVGWSVTDVSDTPQFPGWLLFALFGAIGVAILTIFRPQFARITGPLYAVAEGLVLGSITRVYEVAFEGIALQALLATGATVLVMLVLWATRTIRVTDRLRSMVIGATLGVAAFYVISLLLSLFGFSAPLVWDTGILGIGFSLIVIAIAAFNLLLDFDLIERGVASKAPAYMDWFAAFGLVITIVWLYIEILRLLAKLRSD